MYIEFRSHDRFIYHDELDKSASEPRSPAPERSILMTDRSISRNRGIAPSIYCSSADERGRERERESEIERIRDERDQERGERVARPLGLFAVIGGALTRQTKHRLWPP